jgi:hypothetical protein
MEDEEEKKQKKNKIKREREREREKKKKNTILFKTTNAPYPEIKITKFPRTQKKSPLL